jgi:hypothetical protein
VKKTPVEMTTIATHSSGEGFSPGTGTEISIAMTGGSATNAPAA